MPLSFPPMREVIVDGKARWQATCRTCGQDVCSRPQAVKAAVEELRRAHGYEAECRRAPTLCEWFATCTRPAAGTSPHPILGDVLICQVCADTHSLVVTP